MRIDGIRRDGAYLVILDGGLACIVRGGLSSPALDESEVRPLGPWTETDTSLPARRAMDEHLKRTRTVPLHALKSLADNPFADTEDAPEAPAEEAAPEDDSVDLEALRDDADEMAEEALRMSEDAESAEEHRAAADALEAAAGAQEAIVKLMSPAVPEMGTPEFDAYVEQEVARRVSEAQAALGMGAGAPQPPLTAPAVPVMPQNILPT